MDNQPTAPNTVATQPNPPQTGLKPQPPVVTPPPAVDSTSLLTDKTYEEDLDAKWISWKCLVCSYVYEGQTPKSTCPRCGNSDPDKFD